MYNVQVLPTIGPLPISHKNAYRSNLVVNDDRLIRSIAANRGFNLLEGPSEWLKNAGLLL